MTVMITIIKINKTKQNKDKNAIAVDVRLVR